MPILARFFSIALVSSALLAGCEAPPPHLEFPDLRFTAEPPLQIDVGRLEVQDIYRMPYHEPDVEHLFPVTPLHALENWAHDRLRPVGTGGRVVMQILNARVVEVELPVRQGLQGAFTTQPSERYDLSIEATVQVYDAHGLLARTANVKTERSQSTLQGITPDERDRTWYNMTQAAMVAFDRQMETEIRNNFGLFLVR
ncbi:MAG TPA: hypothetical protein VL993_16755 [Stellaceae bacterium]|nr:hypothetical protein [Stellaceae bacterium]